MAWLFDAVDDDVIVSVPTWATNYIPFAIMGWVFPTTLTAGRTYWGNGSTTGCELAVGPAGSESELRWLGNAATTDGVYDTTDAGIVVNKWHFIAMLNIANTTTDIYDPHIWVGTELEFPRKLTVTQTTAPVGNPSGGANFVLGNRSASASNAIEGEIGTTAQFYVGPAGGPRHPLGHPASTATFGQHSIDLFVNRYMLPFWQGRRDPASIVSSSVGDGNSVVFVPGFHCGGVSMALNFSALGNERAYFDLTLGGTVPQSQNREPVAYQNCSTYPLRRR